MPPSVIFDPQTGQNVYLINGRFGAFIQLGETPEKGSKAEKPKRSSLASHLTADSVTLEDALQLLALPRTVGAHPESGEPILVGIGRYGPYVQHGRIYATIGSDDDVLEIGGNRAIDLIVAKETGGGFRRGSSDPGRPLGTDPGTGAGVVVKSGRYGPYVTDGKTNATIPKSADPETIGLEEALTLLAARREAASLAASLDLTKVTRYVNLIEVGALRNSETGQEDQRGWELELRIPIFDFGGARVARAEHQYMQAVNRATDAAVRARSEVREAYGAYRTAYDLTRHYRDEIVPLRKRISEEMLLRYNGMLSSVFELLADVRETVASVNGYVEAQRDFWQAEADLQMALTTGTPGQAASFVKAAISAAPAAGGH